MKLIELLEDTDLWGIYGGPSPQLPMDGTKSPLTLQGDVSWKAAKGDIYSWFMRPFLTNGPTSDSSEPRCED